MRLVLLNFHAMQQLRRIGTSAKTMKLSPQDLAKRIPDAFISSIPILIPLLDLSDPYVMRAGVLGIIGEIYVQRLTKMNNAVADKKLIDMRDKFADILEQHIHDVNGIGPLGLFLFVGLDSDANAYCTRFDGSFSLHHSKT